MNFEGKYALTTENGEFYKIILRNYYDDSIHAMVYNPDGSIEAGSKVSGNSQIVTLESPSAQGIIRWSLTVQDVVVSGTAQVGETSHTVSGAVSEITPEDDGIAKSEMRKKAMIIYNSMTGNTHKVATWFKETFEHYDWEVTMVRLKNNMDWEPFFGKVYFEDYDVICLGAPIIGGCPPKAILNTFSAGAASSLEDGVAKNAAEGKKFNEGGAGGPAGADVKGGFKLTPEMEQKIRIMNIWHRPEFHRPNSYPGGPADRNQFRPVGIVFTTYGGGFKGSDEALPVLELLKLYLEDKGAQVIGKFSCCGKEFGPAGLDDGVLPNNIKEAPVFYKDADNKYHAGGFFFHCHANSKPGPREEARARGFIADIVEDHFYTASGERRQLWSEFLSIH